MTPDEALAMRQAFEKGDITGYKDFSYNMSTRSYEDPYVQSRWKSWQIAWLAGRRYKPGQVEVEPVPANRVSRTRPS